MMYGVQPAYIPAESPFKWSQRIKRQQTVCKKMSRKDVSI